MDSNETIGTYGMDMSYEATLYHEFIHAWQSCAGKKPRDWTDCQYAMCREIQAYSKANCQKPQTRRQCVMAGVLSSVRESCKSFSPVEQENIFNDLYESCSK
jgi:hypothetical protein